MPHIYHYCYHLNRSFFKIQNIYFTITIFNHFYSCSIFEIYQLFGVQLSSRRFIKDAVNLIVRISMKLLIYHIKGPFYIFLYFLLEICIDMYLRGLLKWATKENLKRK